MRIFLSAAPSRAGQTQWVAAKLRAGGHVVSSTWHRPIETGLEAMATASERHRQIATSDALVALLEEAALDEADAQRDVGYAHALQRPLIEFVGERGVSAASSAWSEVASSFEELLLLVEIVSNARVAGDGASP